MASSVVVVWCMAPLCGHFIYMCSGDFLICTCLLLLYGQHLKPKFEHINNIINVYIYKCEF
jgi:hypothetical protein